MFRFFRMRLDATAGACIAFLCAFRTLIALLSLQYYLDRLKIHIIDFTRHHYPTVVISAPNEVSVDLEPAKYKPHIVVFRNTRLACVIIIIIINLPKRKAYTKGKACTRCPPTKNKHTYTYSRLQTKQYTTKHKTVIKKLLDT